MEPEEIDKLFKNRLNGLPVPPSADAWMRLQAKMEPPRKERSRWMYYVAASVILLLVSGLLILRNYRQNASGNIAQTTVANAKEKKAENLPTAQATPDNALASINKETTVTAEEEQIKPEQKQMPVKMNAALSQEKSGKLAGHTKALKKTKKESYSGKGLEPAYPAGAENSDLIAQENIVPATENKHIPTIKEPIAPGVVQVLIKTDNVDERATTYSEELSLRENINRKGLLLKNLYKQARNLKNGEPVELATLGLDTDKLHAEKENIKQKINKAISL